jgi:hypothetical protein
MTDRTDDKGLLWRSGADTELLAIALAQAYAKQTGTGSVDRQMVANMHRAILEIHDLNEVLHGR